MPSIKYYHNRARTLGILVIASLCCYFAIRAIIEYIN